MALARPTIGNMCLSFNIKLNSGVLGQKKTFKWLFLCNNFGSLMYYLEWGYILKTFVCFPGKKYSVYYGFEISSKQAKNDVLITTLIVTWFYLLLTEYKECRIFLYKIMFWYIHTVCLTEFETITMIVSNSVRHTVW